MNRGDNKIAQIESTPSRRIERIKATVKLYSKKVLNAIKIVGLAGSGLIMVLLLMAKPIVGSGKVPIFGIQGKDIPDLITSLFYYSYGALCLTLAFERIVYFSSIENTIEKLNKSLKKDNLDREKLGREVKVELDKILILLDFVGNKFTNWQNSSDIFWQISMIIAQKGNRGIYLNSADSFTVGSQQIQNFWLQMVKNTDNSWCCTDWVKRQPGDVGGVFWQRAIAKIGLQIQGSMIANLNIKVRRIFIFEKAEDADLELYKMIMREQKAMGIEVRWVTLSCELRDAPLNYFQDRLDTVDFTIIDNKYLFKYIMNEKDVTSIESTCDSHTVREIKEKYNQLFLESFEVT